MAAIDTFDATQVAPQTGRDAIPAGKYKAVIEASEWKDTKAGTGKYLELTFVLIEGEYERRKLWARLNLVNPSDEAVGIARSELSAICHAVGRLKVTDSAALHDLPMTVRVVSKADKVSGEMRNEIKGYEPAGGSAAVKPAASPGTTGNVAGPTAKPGSPAPWKQR